jgi:hypothetical protein
MEFSGDHSARRHMHLEIRGSPFAIFAPKGWNSDSLLFQNAPSRFDSHVKGRRNQVIRRPDATLIFELPRGQPTWCFVPARTRPG